ncbi:Dabb family protein [Aspergillus melleus]|uniref:Dabb family protein n=1 Tax=Aspergillus melleus TaxID=138277 RepID=UPI001E8EF225|nr:uncharacterized protein LDX57_000354 [Aspergillus melleus]KAH8422600.1 hypothetical protein LDX57_000354 [Aspergillus melleus]
MVPRRPVLFFITSILLIVSVFWLHPFSFSTIPLQHLGQTSKSNMSITHIVLFQFKSEASAEAINDACDRMLALRDKCLHPSSQKPYIQTSSGGRDNSPEGIQGGITHAFVIEFATAEDRDYYVAKDPAHQEFIRSLDGLIEKAQVIDFTNGVF